MDDQTLKDTTHQDELKPQAPNPIPNPITPKPEEKPIEEVPPQPKPEQPLIEIPKEIPLQPKADSGLAEEKKAVIAKKEQVFKKVVFGAKILLIAILIGAVSASIYFYIRSKSKSQYGETPPAPVVVPMEPTVTWKQYDSPIIKVKFKYSKEAKLFEETAFDKRVVVSYSQKNDETTAPTILNLKEGYMFMVSPLDLKGRTLDEIATVKREAFHADCPKETQISASLPTLVYNIDSRSFEVRNCNSDFKVTYVPRFGIFYEILQAYKGDIGYIQQYKSDTEEVLKTLEFYPEEKPPESKYKTFTSERYSFVFEYPKDMEQDCCDIPKPPAGDSEKIVVLGNKVDNEKFNGIAVYTVKRENKISFLSFVDNQMQVLISDYKVARGTDPVIIEESIKVGPKKAIRLRGLSWKGNDLIYVDTENSIGEYFLVISLNNVSGESFENVLKPLLKSFKFYK